MSSPSCCTGQRALQTLIHSNSTISSIGNNNSNNPNNNNNIQNRLLTDLIPKELAVTDRAAFKSKDDSSAGIHVLKVTRSGKLQARRIGVLIGSGSAHQAQILITTTRIKSVKGLWKKLGDVVAAAAAAKGGGSDSASNLKSIPVLTIDRIQRGASSKRFLHAEALRIVSSRDKGNENRNEQQQHDNKNNRQQHQLLLEQDQNVSFSILYYSTETNTMESLDLVVPSWTDYEVFVSCLEHIVKRARATAALATPELQLLQYYWIAVLHCQDVSTDCITSSEWMTLTEKLSSVPLSKSTLLAMFRDRCATVAADAADAADACGNLDDAQPTTTTTTTTTVERLSLADVAVLWQAVREKAVPVMKNPLEQLWKQLLHNDPIPVVGMHNDGENDTMQDDESLEMSLANQEESISAVAFLSFLRSQQKEFQTTLEQAAALIQKLNRLQSTDDWEFQQHDRLTKCRFMAFLASDANDLLRPDMGQVGADDMTQPLSHYWISTSHDTYLAAVADSFQGKCAYAKDNNHNNQPPDLVDSQAYHAALLRGVRCLELDIWDGLVGEPVVARTKPEKIGDRKSTPLAVVLRTIRHFLQHHPDSFPVILRLENHCSSPVQTKVAQDIYDYLGAADLILQPEKDLTDLSMKLPSPQSARGKVILMGKRPKPMASSVVVNDDFDSSNTQLESISQEAAHSLQNEIKYDEANEDEDGVVTGFDENGPIRSKDATALVISPDVLLQEAIEEAQELQRQLEEARRREAELMKQSNEQETLAATLTLQAGMTASEVKRRAAIAAGRAAEAAEDDDRGTDGIYHYKDEEEKTMKDEGIEVHEILPETVQGCKDRYAYAAQEALQAAQKMSKAEAKLQEAEKAYQKALHNLDTVTKNEQEAAEKARRAASDARAEFEHAAAAKERVETVRELLRNSKNRSSSAITVVQTATTEAKISEKRAADAEARAARARAAADKDRCRADEETKIEESMEQEVSDFHEECIKAVEAAKEARQRVEKAMTLLERVNEQIRVIENGVQYRQEQMDMKNAGNEYDKEGPFTAKHSAKLEERSRCFELIKEAKKESASADSNRVGIHAKFEEKAHAWRIQAEVAAQARRTADRSASIAEELAEHAEEEREAAELRHVARKKAEAAVEDGSSHTQSIEAQLAEAERAAAEASKLAVLSRQRADRLAREAEAAKDHTRAEELVESKKWEVKQAQGEYDAARLVKEQKHAAKKLEKHRLDTDRELVKNAARDAGISQIKVESLYEHEAIVAFNTALVLRRESKNATRRVETLEKRSETKNLAAKRAREYKEFKDMSVRIPSSLAKATHLHTLRFKHWDISNNFSNAHVHSFSQNVLIKMVESNPEEERKHMEKFTKDHLCRVFPSWHEIMKKSTSNYDPVLAWSLGCQLVAMNYHSADENVLVADGLFRKNGSCGYVLKPKYLLGEHADSTVEQKWSFKVLAAFNLPRVGKRTMNPFVTVSLYDGSETAARTIYKTSTVEGNGLNPVWDESKSIKLTIEKPQVAMISFAVWSKDEKFREFIGGAAIPAVCLREGYRSIPLFRADHSRSGTHVYASLVVNALKR